MKNKKGRKRIGLVLDIVLIMVVVILIGGSYCYRQCISFYQSGIDGVLITTGDAYQTQEDLSKEYDSSKEYRLKKHVLDRKRILLSNIYYIESNHEKQIRLRFLMLNPFFKGDIVRSQITITNETGEVLNLDSLYQESFLRCDGLEVTFDINKQNFHFEKGEKLVLTISIPKDEGDVNGSKESIRKEDAAGYIKTEITMP